MLGLGYAIAVIGANALDAISTVRAVKRLGGWKYEKNPIVTGIPSLLGIKAFAIVTELSMIGYLAETSVTNTLIGTGIVVAINCVVAVYNETRSS